MTISISICFHSEFAQKSLIASQEKKKKELKRKLQKKKN